MNAHGEIIAVGLLKVVYVVYIHVYIHVVYKFKSHDTLERVFLLKSSLLLVVTKFV